MEMLHDDRETDNLSTEGWTGEQDSAAAVALCASLVLAALLFLFFAAGLLHA
jgi:hypothetical protein